MLLSRLLLLAGARAVVVDPPRAAIEFPAEIALARASGDALFPVDAPNATCVFSRAGQAYSMNIPRWGLGEPGGDEIVARAVVLIAKVWCWHGWWWLLCCHGSDDFRCWLCHLLSHRFTRFFFRGWLEHN